MEKRYLPLPFIIADRLKKADHPLLDKIVRIAANQKQGIRFFAHKRFVLVKNIIHDPGLACPKQANQLLIRLLFIFFCPIFSVFHLLSPRFLQLPTSILHTKRATMN